MDASTLWLHADQLGSPAYSLSALHEFANLEPYSLQTPDTIIDGHALDAFATEIEQSMGNSEEDALMMDLPLLDYINDMLMDETMDDRILVPRDCVAYQSMLNSLYNIIDEHSPPALSSSSSDNVDTNDLVSGLLNDDNTSIATVSITCTDICTSSGKASKPELSSSNSAHFSDMLLAPTNTSYSGSGVVTGKDSLLHIFDDKLAAEKHNHSQSDSTRSIPTVQAETSDRYVSLVKNKVFNMDTDYKRLYLDKIQLPSHERTVYGEGKGRGEKQNNGHGENKRHRSRTGRAGVKGKKGHVEAMPKKQADIIRKTLEAGVALDLKELLVSCAQAVSVGNAMRAFETLQQLRRNGASATGSGLHRVLHYFCEALEARIHGVGSHAYSDAAYNNRPSVAETLKAMKRAFSFIPIFKCAHYFANQSILKAAEGATRLHIIDYGIFYGFQWPCLINALAEREEGPPTLVITGIEFPQPGINSAEGLEDIGRRLSEYAKTYNVPFEYHAIAASHWEDVDPISHTSGDGQEVVVVNCMHRLRHVFDESAAGSHDYSASCPRQKLLEKMCKLNPDLFVVAVVNASHNSPFFVSRFREALNYYCSKFDLVDTTWDTSLDRTILEKDCFYRDILNIVACEGFERVERPETYRQWQARIRRAGFEQMQVMPSVFARLRAHVQNYYHKDFNVDHDSNRWMLVSWKGRTMEAVSAWRPSGM
ncbi:hypothetical protein L7F22_011682 [Adiantum nelumboides]|nr:hypothetical protein [Adiantum nelumboides]